MRRFFAVCTLVGAFFCSLDSAVAGDNWAGFFVRGGVAYGWGDLTVRHEHPKFSLGDFVSVPTDGDLLYGAIGYRWPLTNQVYLTGKGELYDGDLAGSRRYRYGPASANFHFSTTLTGTAGVQLAREYGRHGEYLLAVGGGFAASKVRASATGGLHGHSASWQSGDGGTIGHYFEVEAIRRLTDRSGVFLNAKRVYYNAHEACSFEGSSCGTFPVETKPWVVSIGAEFRF